MSATREMIGEFCRPVPGCPPMVAPIASHLREKRGIATLGGSSDPGAHRHPGPDDDAQQRRFDQVVARELRGDLDE